MTGHRLKFAAIVGACALFALALLGTCHQLALLSANARIASSRPKSIWHTCMRYAEDHEGKFPPLSAEYGRFMPDASIGPGYWLPAVAYYSESSPDAPSYNLRSSPDYRLIDDTSFAYLGFVLEDEAQGLAFLEAYRRRAERGGGFSEPLAAPPGKGNAGAGMLYPLREAQALRDIGIRTPPSEIPVAVEWPGNYYIAGGNVAFLDGSTRFIEYPGE